MTVLRRFGFRRHAAASLAAMAAVAALSLSASPCWAQASAPGTASTAGWTLDALMSMLAHNKSGRASFVETKTLSIATKPLESSGELVFAAPDHLEKLTTSPKPERLVVDGDKLTIERDQRTVTLALNRYPELSAFIESIRATLDGDRPALERIYQVALDGNRDDWTLTLTPLDARTSKAIRTVTLRGARDALRTVVIEQADGDHSVMQLKDESRD
ncbi:outer membrane lipoprotein carrier protein LolA [Trinickia violacea]|uniref:Outer membrane lipoprotein carrier protein LolA n=1 Tax=Trinickia violacea TaxID=2571746 RepID=A0A4P8IMZ7_9BURK|nr:LolA-related protein [Trinickia violacea]QCP48895.1 outer membrane lipoprotein carrier protein LolA [Trinickia violacea]